MKRSFQRLLAAGTAAVALAAAAPFAPAANAGPASPVVPDEIAVPDGHKVFLVAHAVGVQVYSCNPAAGGAKWGFVGPRADLYGENGRFLGTHYGGPTWQAKDGSSVKAQRQSDATPDPTAIAWLRLAATRTTAGADGDRLGATTYIQRTATTGGLEPSAATCTTTTIGTIEEVDYTADYIFWKAA
jgi:hypothetical protein